MNYALGSSSAFVQGKENTGYRKLPNANQAAMIRGSSTTSFSGTISLRKVMESARAPTESVSIALSVFRLPT